MWEQILFIIYDYIDIHGTSHKIVNLECEASAREQLDVAQHSLPM